MPNVFEVMAAGGAFDSVMQERRRQDTKWGEQNHPALAWMSILMEEVGELAEAVNETHFDNGPDARRRGGIDNIRKEAVQVAAVAVALIECLDRNKAAQPHTVKPEAIHGCSEDYWDRK